MTRKQWEKYMTNILILFTYVAGLLFGLMIGQ